MGWPKCNATLETESIDETPIWHGMQFHHFGEILAAVFGIVAILFSWYLIWRHCTHYLKPYEQRHIIRVLFMVPIYAFVSFLSYYFYRRAVYFEVIRDCYEAFAIASFFSLLCHYIAPNLHDQKDYFRTINPKGWVWPVMVIEGACVSIAMYSLIQFYYQLRLDLAEHSPLLKVVAIKLVIFLSFWQTLLISFLTSAGAIKASPHISTPDIKIGIPSLLLCIEMAIFSVFHLWAFPWKVYDIRRSPIVASESAAGFMPDPKNAYKGGPFGVHALMDAFNPWDLIKAVGRGFKWAAVGHKRRTEDISYKTSARGTGLEPTRNQLTAFDTGGRSFDGQPGYDPNVKPGRYHPLTEPEEDSDRLLAHAQSNPADPAPYPRPMERLPQRGSAGVTAGDIGTMGIYDPPPHPPPDNLHHLGQGYQSTGTTNPEQDTSYHGGARLTPVPPPDPHPLGPPGRKSHEQQDWDMWGGAQGQSERDLGGDHGVGDNRF